MICRNAVPWPWPWSCVPIATVSVPVGSKRSSACSIRPEFEASTVFEMPMPRSLPRLRRLASPRIEARIVRHGQAVVEVLGEVAAVVGVDQRGLVRHRVGRNGVAPAQLGRVDAELARGEIDHGLDHVGGFRPSGAAIVAGEHGVGEGGVHLDVAGRDRVGAARARRYCWSAGRRCGRSCGRRRCSRRCAPEAPGICRPCRARARPR